MTRRPQQLLAGMAVGALLAVAGALVTQHVLGMLPCAWCVLQRLIFVAVAAASLLGLVAIRLLPGVLGTRLGAGLALVLAGLGMAAALWQHVVANASASCNMTLADRVMGATGLDSRFPEVFAAYASCADAKVDLFGMPYEFWSLALFVGLLLLSVQLLRQR